MTTLMHCPSFNLLAPVTGTPRLLRSTTLSAKNNIINKIWLLFKIKMSQIAKVQQRGRKMFHDVGAGARY